MGSPNDELRLKLLRRVGNTGTPPTVYLFGFTGAGKSSLISTLQTAARALTTALIGSVAMAKESGTMSVSATDVVVDHCCRETPVAHMVDTRGWAEGTKAEGMYDEIYACVMGGIDGVFLRGEKQIASPLQRRVAKTHANANCIIIVGSPLLSDQQLREYRALKDMLNRADLGHITGWVLTGPRKEGQLDDHFLDIVAPLHDRFAKISNYVPRENGEKVPTDEAIDLKALQLLESVVCQWADVELEVKSPALMLWETALRNFPKDRVAKALWSALTFSNCVSICGSAVALVLLAALCGSASSRTAFVSNAGSDNANDCSSASRPCLSIAWAASGSDVDSVRVLGDSYAVSASVSLSIGSGGSLSVVGNGTASQKRTLLVVSGKASSAHTFVVTGSPGCSFALSGFVYAETCDNCSLVSATNCSASIVDVSYTPASGARTTNRLVDVTTSVPIGVSTIDRVVAEYPAGSSVVWPSLVRLVNTAALTSPSSGPVLSISRSTFSYTSTGNIASMTTSALCPSFDGEDFKPTASYAYRASYMAAVWCTRCSLVVDSVVVHDTSVGKELIHVEGVQTRSANGSYASARFSNCTFARITWAERLLRAINADVSVSSSSVSSSSFGLNVIAATSTVAPSVDSEEYVMPRVSVTSSSFSKVTVLGQVTQGCKQPTTPGFGAVYSRYTQLVVNGTSFDGVVSTGWYQGGALRLQQSKATITTTSFARSGLTYAPPDAAVHPASGGAIWTAGLSTGLVTLYGLTFGSGVSISNCFAEAGAAIGCSAGSLWNLGAVSLSGLSGTGLISQTSCLCDGTTCATDAYECAIAGTCVDAVDQLYVDPTSAADIGTCTSSNPCTSIAAAVALINSRAVASVLVSLSSGTHAIVSAQSVVIPYGVSVSFVGAGQASTVISSAAGGFSVSGGGSFTLSSLSYSEACDNCSMVLSYDTAVQLLSVQHSVTAVAHLSTRVLDVWASSASIKQTVVRGVSVVHPAGSSLKWPSLFRYQCTASLATAASAPSILIENTEISYTSTGTTSTVTGSCTWNGEDITNPYTIPSTKGPLSVTSTVWCSKCRLVVNGVWVHNTTIAKELFHIEGGQPRSRTEQLAYATASFSGLVVAGLTGAERIIRAYEADVAVSGSSFSSLKLGFNAIASTGDAVSSNADAPLMSVLSISNSTFSGIQLVGTSKEISCTTVLAAGFGALYGRNAAVSITDSRFVSIVSVGGYQGGVVRLNQSSCTVSGTTFSRSGVITTVSTPSTPAVGGAIWTLGVSNTSSVTLFTLSFGEGVAISNCFASSGHALACGGVAVSGFEGVALSGSGSPGSLFYQYAGVMYCTCSSGAKCDGSAFDCLGSGACLSPTQTLVVDPMSSNDTAVCTKQNPCRTLASAVAAFSKFTGPARIDLALGTHPIASPLQIVVPPSLSLAIVGAGPTRSLVNSTSGGFVVSGGGTFSVSNLRYLERCDNCAMVSSSDVATSVSSVTYSVSAGSHTSTRVLDLAAISPISPSVISGLVAVLSGATVSWASLVRFVFSGSVADPSAAPSLAILGSEIRYTSTGSMFTVSQGYCPAWGGEDFVQSGPYDRRSYTATVWCTACALAVSDTAIRDTSIVTELFHVEGSQARSSVYQKAFASASMTNVTVVRSSFERVLRAIEADVYISGSTFADSYAGLNAVAATGDVTTDDTQGYLLCALSVSGTTFANISLRGQTEPCNPLIPPFGALYGNSADVALRNCTFRLISQTGGYSGGAVRLLRSRALVEGTSFLDCSTAASSSPPENVTMGGAIAFCSGTDCSNGDLNIPRVLFTLTLGTGIVTSRCNASYGAFLGCSGAHIVGSDNVRSLSSSDVGQLFQSTKCDAGLNCSVACSPGWAARSVNGTCECSRCPSATYQQWVCTPCLPGTTSDGGVAQCSPCQPGTYSTDGISCVQCGVGRASKSGAGSCSECPAGFYTLDGISCLKCGDGYTSTGGINCTRCPAGTYELVGVCTPCRAGFVSGEGATRCSECPAGTVSYRSLVCRECDNGTYASTSSTCTRCSPGFISVNHTSACAPCPVGSFEVGNVACVPCALGSVSALGSRSCSVCPTGMIATNGTKCNYCTPGYEESGNERCVLCRSGYVSLLGANCSMCPAGTFAAQGTCKSCDAGSTSVAGQDNCTKCPAGTRERLRKTCIPCGPGLSSSLGSTSCWPCPNGTYELNHLCVSCPPGQWSVQNSTSCISCPWDMHDRDHLGCDACAQGFFSYGDLSACLPCPAGTYKSGKECVSCPIGHVSSEGATNCTLCPPGKLEYGRTECKNCSAGHVPNYTGPMCLSCVPCPAGTYEVLNAECLATTATVATVVAFKCGLIAIISASASGAGAGIGLGLVVFGIGKMRDRMMMDPGDTERKETPDGEIEAMPLRQSLEVVEPAVDKLETHWTAVEQTYEKLVQQHGDLGISKDEAVALLMYTTESQPREGSIYFRMNQSLREREACASSTWFPFARNLIRAMRKIIPFKGKLYRGIDRKVDPTQYCPGNVVSWKGFTSTTGDRIVAQEFLRDLDGTIFEISVKNGRRLGVLNLFQEDEILLEASSDFRVESITGLEPGSRITLVKMEEVDALFPLVPLSEAPVATSVAPDGSVEMGVRIPELPEPPWMRAPSREEDRIEEKALVRPEDAAAAKSPRKGSKRSHSGKHGHSKDGSHSSRSKSETPHSPPAKGKVNEDYDQFLASLDLEEDKEAKPAPSSGRDSRYSTYMKTQKHEASTGVETEEAQQVASNKYSRYSQVEIKPQLPSPATEAAGVGEQPAKSRDSRYSHYQKPGAEKHVQIEGEGGEESRGPKQPQHDSRYSFYKKPRDAASPSQEKQEPPDEGASLLKEREEQSDRAAPQVETAPKPRHDSRYSHYKHETEGAVPQKEQEPARDPHSKDEAAEAQPEAIKQEGASRAHDSRYSHYKRPEKQQEQQEKRKQEPRHDSRYSHYKAKDTAGREETSAPQTEPATPPAQPRHDSRYSHYMSSTAGAPPPPESHT
eukprot:m51a1_g3916 putative protein serine threonine (2990) ;mRNA; f:162039-172590